MPDNFNPLLTDNRVWLYDGLVRFDEEMNPIPDLAESWEISPDAQTFTFKVEDKASFEKDSYTATFEAPGDSK